MTETQERRVPDPLPIPAEKPKSLMERAQAMFPKMVPGKTAEVNRKLAEVRDYAKYAIEYWETQAKIAEALIQMEMGDAEVATVDSKPVLVRMQHPVKGHWVNDGDRDFLRSASK